MSFLASSPIRLESFRSERGIAIVQTPARGILYSKVQGHADLALAKHLMEAFDRVAADWSPVESFHDWQGVQSYDSEARDAYIQWAQGHRPKVLRVHILTGSKLVAMAVAVAKLKLDYLEPYTDQKAFEERKFEAIWRRLRELR